MLKIELLPILKKINKNKLAMKVDIRINMLSLLYFWGELSLGYTISRREILVFSERELSLVLISCCTLCTLYINNKKYTLQEKCAKRA